MEFITLWTNNEYIRNNCYKQHKIYTILKNIFSFMVNMDYTIDLEYNDNGGIDFGMDTIKSVNELIKNIYNKICKWDYNNIDYGYIGGYENDDYYCLILMDNDKNIIYHLFWDYDFDIINGYQFTDNFNILQWVIK